MLRLKWERTGLGRGDDFIARDPEVRGSYCRIYKSTANSSGLPWFWTASDGHVDLGSDYAATKADAAAAAEEAYFAGRDRPRA